MSSIHKSIIDNTVPTLRAVNENGNNHNTVVVVSYVLLSLLMVSMATTLIVNSIRLHNHICENKKNNSDGK